MIVDTTQEYPKAEEMIIACNGLNVNYEIRAKIS